MSGPGLRGRVLAGITWSAAYQVFSVVVQFGTMLVLVRLVAPADYGRVAAVVGLLHVINAFGAATFISQALQLPAGEEPDWTLHWHCGLWIQGWLAIGCLALAAVASVVPPYDELALLLGVAAVGLLIDAPSRLRMAQLQRALDYRRLRLVAAASTLTSVATSLGMASAGHGALGLVLGGNVVISIPFSADLLRSGWRPTERWWRWPDWARYRPALRFGAFQGGAGVLRSLRGALVGIVLPATMGYEALGLLGRAEALFSSTVQRVSGLLGDTVYPILPQCADDEGRFRRVAGAYAEVTAIVVVLGAAFVAFDGPLLSRLLYGERWAAVDPLIAPQALAGLCLALGGLGYRLLLARGQLRPCLGIDVLTAALGGGVALATSLVPDVELYAWAHAATSVVVFIVAVALARPQPGAGWWAALLPPAAAALAGAATLQALQALPARPPDVPLWLEVALRSGGFAAGALAAMRLAFPSYLQRNLALLPAGQRLNALLRLDPGPGA
ncbi:MAG: oligosaccharide flippase family protein [Planctomycetota bacterium]|nr:oligosaccharide flippase family protein [Planctomycetota bacterium]